MYESRLVSNKKYLSRNYEKRSRYYEKRSRYYEITISLLREKISLGCGSVILLRPKMEVAPHKHDVFGMQTQQCTNTKHISIEKYHPVVSITLRYLDQIKTFGENLCCRAVKNDKMFGVTYRTLLSNATTFRNDWENKRSVRTKHIS